MTGWLPSSFHTAYLHRQEKINLSWLHTGEVTSVRTKTLLGHPPIGVGAFYKKYVIIILWEPIELRRLPFLSEGLNPPDERKEGDTMITYSEFFQFCAFVIALVYI